MSIPGGRRLATRFDTIPDVPVTKFSLSLVSGENGPVGTVTSLCSAKARRATAALGFRGQNGRLVQVNQQALDRPNLDKYAEELGLNMAKFKAALDSGKFKDRVDREAKEGNAVGATGTPTFFINGKKLVGAQPVDAFKAAIDAELK